MNTDLILQNIEKHIRLDKDEIDFFISLLQYKKFKRRDFLLKQGNVCKTENYILKGCLRMYTIDESGVEHNVMFAHEDWWIEDTHSFLTQTPATFFIDALEETEVLQITHSNLERLFERVPKFERFFRIILQNFIAAQLKRINQTLSYSAEQRYLEFINKYPELEQRISQKQISSYLGITPVFMSMILKKMSNR